MIEFFTDELGIAPTRKAGDAGFDFYVPNASEKIVAEIIEDNPSFLVTCNIVSMPKKVPRKDEKGEVLLDKDGKPIIDMGHEDMICLMPHCGIKLPTHVYSKMPDNVCIRMSNKSGVCTKTQLIVGAEIIDPSYQGQIHMHVINTGNTPTYIAFGKKLVQGIPIIFDNETANCVSGTDPFKDGFFTEKTERGAGGFGSTGLDQQK